MIAALSGQLLASCAETDTGDGDEASDAGLPGTPGSPSDSGGFSIPTDSGVGSPLPVFDAGATPRVDSGISLPLGDARLPSLDGGLPNLFGDGGLTLPDIFGSSDAGQSAKPDGGGKSPSDPMCQGAICFDVFDCYIFSPDKLDCGFTSCELGVCK